MKLFIIGIIWCGAIAVSSCNNAFADTMVADDVEVNANIFNSIKEDPNPLIVYGEPAGASIEFMRTGASTCGRYLLAKVTVPPGSGPPPHIHHLTDEWFYAPDGGAVMFMGNREYKDVDNPPDKIGKDTLTLTPLEKGELMYGPRFIIHGYVNATNKPIIVYIVWTPDTPDVSILGYFISIAEPVFMSNKLNSIFNPIVQIKAVSEAKKYGMNFSHDFWQYVSNVNYSRSHHDNKRDKLVKLFRAGDMPCK